MKKNKKKWKQKQADLSNAVVVDSTTTTQQEFEFIKANDDLENADILTDSILVDGEKMKLNAKFHVEIPRKIFYKLLTYAKLLDEEITGLGMVERVGNYAFRITEIFLLKQVVSKAACKIDTEDQFALVKRLVEEGKDPGKLKCWWHSHNSMGAFWSSTDERTSEKSVCDYFVSLVITHSGELGCKVGIYQPILLELDDVKVVMVDNEPVDELIKECKAEIELKVMKEKDRVITGFGGLNQHRANEPIGVGAEKKEEVISGTDINIQNQNYFSCGYEFRWNHQNQMYDVFDAITRKQLTWDEIEALGLLPDADPMYNSPSWQRTEMY